MPKPKKCKSNFLLKKEPFIIRTSKPKIQEKLKYNPSLKFRDRVKFKSLTNEFSYSLCWLRIFFNENNEENTGSNGGETPESWLN